MPFLEWMVFGLRGGQYRRSAERRGLHVAKRVFGLARTGSVDEAYMCGVVGRMKGPVDEIFFHPDLSTEAGRRELGTLTSPSVREAASARGISLAGYGELKRGVAVAGSVWERP